MKLVQSLFNLMEGIVPGGSARRLANWAVDRYYGLETVGTVALKDLGVPEEERMHYAPSGWFTLQRIARSISFNREDVFIDFGSGKGRVVVMAARYYAFKRVMGVEIAAELNEVARANIERNRRRLRCQKIDLVTSDALGFAPPEDMTVAYFYSPFYGAIFKGVVENIRRSWEKRPNRRLWVVLQRPLESPNLALYNANNDLLVASPWLRHVETATTNSHSIAIYQALPS